MERTRVLEWIHDRILSDWRAKLFLLPGLEALPTTGVALYVGSGHDAFFGIGSAWLIFVASLLGGLIAGCRAYFTERGQELFADVRTKLMQQISDLERKLLTEIVNKEMLLRLIAHVRVIVVSKSRRFHDALQKLPTPIDPGAAFLTITKPDEQIKEIVRNIHAFFSFGDFGGRNESIAVLLMQWNDTGRYLEYGEYFPPHENPKMLATEFRDSHSVAGKAYFDQQMVICEKRSENASYKRRQGAINEPGGSMFAFPAFDDFEHRVGFVINVVSSAEGRFTEEQRDTLKIPMEVFAERLLLENRLVGLRAKVIS